MTVSQFEGVYQTTAPVRPCHVGLQLPVNLRFMTSCYDTMKMRSPGFPYISLAQMEEQKLPLKALSMTESSQCTPPQSNLQSINSRDCHLIPLFICAARATWHWRHSEGNQAKIIFNYHMIKNYKIAISSQSVELRRQHKGFQMDRHRDNEPWTKESYTGHRDLAKMTYPGQEQKWLGS